jgi:hypothetical protein
MRSSRRSLPRIHELLVTLSDVEPPVWRRLRISSGATLERTARVIAVAMGWPPNRSFAFCTERERFASGAEDDCGRGVETLRLRQLLPDSGSQLEFEYGDGQSWALTLVLERILPPDDEVITPVCLGGWGSAPPVDIGGPWAYEEWRSGGPSGCVSDWENSAPPLLDGVGSGALGFNVALVNAELERLRR